MKKKKYTEMLADADWYKGARGEGVIGIQRSNPTLSTLDSEKVIPAI